MAHNSAFPRVIAPTQREHVAVGFGNDGLVPALLRILLGDNQIAKADLLPIPRQIGPGAARRPDPAAPGPPLSGGLVGWAFPFGAAATSLS